MNQRPLWIVGSIIVVTMVVTIYNTNVTPQDTRPCEELSTGQERERVIKSISTRGMVCSDLRRIGGLTKKPSRAASSFGPDGMWYVCFDEQVQLNPGSCVVYSFGIGNDFSFDEKMATYGCNVFSFDPTMDKEDHRHSPGVMFYNLGLSDVDQERPRHPRPWHKFDKMKWKTRTFKTIMLELGHFKREIDILKMDIESDEWKSLRQMLTDGTLKSHVRQLNVEYHISSTTEALRQSYDIIKWLEKEGFKIFHSRKNPQCRKCWELSYVNSNLVNIPLN
ncbi:unnamed protein product [Porites evermanni]|uniref:Methyltransferase domain-containing protein n=1 Tax=Porites evermanni TaxID=104178 RepID=A0ABN8SU42_9CNID|nr:unnamed protein product [Porites evermanni]